MKSIHFISTFLFSKEDEYSHQWAKKHRPVTSTLGTPTFTKAMTQQQLGNLIQTRGLLSEKKIRKKKSNRKCLLKSFTCTQGFKFSQMQKSKYIKESTDLLKFSYFTYIYQNYSICSNYSFLLGAKYAQGTTCQTQEMYSLLLFQTDLPFTLLGKDTKGACL